MSILQTMSVSQPLQASSSRSASSQGQDYANTKSQSPPDALYAIASSSPSSAATASSSTSGADPVSSLRAKALLSMKSKRRKVADGPQPIAQRMPLPVQPLTRPIEDAIMLDYGSEEQETEVKPTINTIEPEKDSIEVHEAPGEVEPGDEEGGMIQIVDAEDDATEDMDVENEDEEEQLSSRGASTSASAQPPVQAQTQDTVCNFSLHTEFKS